MELLMAHKFEIVTFLFLLSEALGTFPQVKANTTYQLVLSALTKIKLFLGK